MEKRAWVVVYDIGDHRSRHRVARVLRTVGFHIQRSTFYIQSMSQREIQALISRLEKHINRKTDRLFVYPVEELEHAEGYLIKPWETFII
ncbi:MAG: CRISPR-associated endonuclease Cas2 [Aquificaceae bacterium]|jgi:CRISPR-associated endonuclease Cas2|uniref:CRISPR-associated endonuclease Cas2 n=1 Tax=Hydrogenobacter sp. Uz 6-8 TaxID=3384828 RepID=UPI000F1996E0|nr:MAG: CRISPR-associated endonuclease Cas2 [Aquificota bacterium]